jgi:hypothetical protein
VHVQKRGGGVRKKLGGEGNSQLKKEVRRVPLQGTLDVVRFADVALLLGRRRLTGRLEVRSGDVIVQLYFENGLVAGMATRGRPHEAHGEPVYRLAEVCSRLLPADRGSFDFRPGMPYSGVERIQTDVKTLLTAARTHLEDWRSLESVIPSLEARPRVAEELVESEVTLSAPQWRVLRAVDGRRSLRAIARALDLSELDVSRALKGLVEAKLVELDLEPAVAGNPPKCVALGEEVPELVSIGVEREARTADGSDVAISVVIHDEPAAGEALGESSPKQGWRRRDRGRRQPATVPADPPVPQAG